MRSLWDERASSGNTYESIRKLFGCGFSTVRDIVQRRTRRDVEPCLAYEIVSAWGLQRGRVQETVQIHLGGSPIMPPRFITVEDVEEALV